MPCAGGTQHLRIFDYALVTVLGFLAGGWAIPAAVTFGLEPVGVWLTASTGSSLELIVMVWLGGRGRERLDQWLGRTERHAESNERARRIVDRWGVLGLSVFGVVVLGPTLSVVAGLTLDVDRRRFLRGAVIATCWLYAGITALWSLVL